MHKQITTYVKAEPGHAVVDEIMVPVVHWLNSFDGISTHLCCEGNPGERTPYVAFTFDNKISLSSVLYKIHELKIVKEDEMYVNAFFSDEIYKSDTIMMMLSFSSQRSLETFCKYLRPTFGEY